MDELLCRKVTKLLLPAIRASVAETLEKNYNFTQQEVAKRLGIVQVAVSKYANKRYSKEVMQLKNYIDSKGLNAGIVKSIVEGINTDEVNRRINTLCNENSLLKLLASIN